ncbi:MAG TPA: NfeD family protein, partial [Thermomicrobiales bacterium]|nr:NfeD family protein [Thermomicrobiales bacterium]
MKTFARVQWRTGPRPPRGRFPLLPLIAVAIWLAGLLPMLPRAVAQSPDGAPVYIADITGVIDLGLAPYLQRVLDEAAETNSPVILNIDTPGGRLDAVLQMQDALLDSEVRTIAFVNRTAFSAGALIAISAEEIYMVPGAVMGAATPIEGATGETASEKVISAVRKTFKTTAEVRGRNPEVAEAMVDPEVAIDGLVERGELLTLTDTEAAAWGYADGVVANRAALLEATGLAGQPIEETSPSLAESIVRFITNPVVSSLLILGAILLIVGDALVGGFGIVGGVGLGMLALFFFGYQLAGLAGWEDLALIVLGLLLLGVEIFVVPGFGVPGVLGLAALLGGLVMTMLGRDIQTSDQIQRAALTVGVSLVLAIVAVIALLMLVPRSRRAGALVLQAELAGPSVPAGTPFTRSSPGKRSTWLGRLFGGGEDLEQSSDHVAWPRETTPVTLLGKRGTALSDLRPGGIADIDGQRVDVVSEGGYIRSGEAIEVVADERYRRVVRRVK